jgi:hypothetical protein
MIPTQPLMLIFVEIKSVEKLRISQCPFVLVMWSDHSTLLVMWAHTTRHRNQVRLQFCAEIIGKTGDEDYCTLIAVLYKLYMGKFHVLSDGCQLMEYHIQHLISLHSEAARLCWRQECAISFRLPFSYVFVGFPPILLPMEVFPWCNRVRNACWYGH